MSNTKGAERLAGRTAVVTGASRGIGLEIARGLVAEGARVVLIARSERTLADIATSLGDLALPLACDVSREADVMAAVTRIRATVGVPDILVNNAGSFSLASIETVDPMAFEDIVETNLVAPLRFVRAFLNDMHVRRAGHVVTIGSVVDRAVFSENAAYAASKHGARALHEVLRLETRGSGVRATLISPGPVDTPLWDPLDPDNRDGFTPRALMLRAAAVADAVLYAVTRPDDVNIDELRLSRS
ncbi:MAG TPA: SDR family oxidoreductase [Gemmatimonadaceae bacterium]|nr:SDR family oxidoreductase [Gemmatimonadaceae bacterium]